MGSALPEGAPRGGVRLRASLALIPMLCVLQPAACNPDEGRPCYPGDYRWCQCEHGLGYEQCTADGEGYGQCDCSGARPGEQPDSGAGDAGDPCDAASGKVGFLCPCKTNADCQSGICHSYMKKGFLCTQSCAGGEACPSPSDGCNLMGVCKAP